MSYIACVAPLAIVIILVTIIAVIIETSPSGYEDETGFHYGDK